MHLLAGYWNHLCSLEKLISQLRDLGVREASGPVKPVRRARQLDETAVDELVSAYLRGTPGHELAAQFGINESTVYAQLSRRQVERRPYRKLHGDQLRQAIDLYEGGHSLRAVAHEVGVSTSAVHSALTESGVRMRPRRPQS